MESEIKSFIKNNQIYLIMQNTSNDTKYRYKLILCSILIPEYDIRLNLNSNYRKDSCISRTFLLKFWVKNCRCGLYTRPLI